MLSHTGGICVQTEAVSEVCSLEHRGLEDWPMFGGACRSSVFTADSCQQHLRVAQLSVSAGPLCQALQAKGNQPAVDTLQFQWFCVVGLLLVDFCRNVNRVSMPISCIDFIIDCKSQTCTSTGIFKYIYSSTFRPCVKNDPLDCKSQTWKSWKKDQE